MNKPKVTIVVPVYNAERYLNESLDSIIYQTYKNIEIICVDDGSTDTSLEILQDYRSKDQRIQILKQQNQYAGIARNNGMNHATGDYIMFLDSDDIFEKNTVEYLVKKAEKYVPDIIVFGYNRFISDVKKKRPVKNKYKNGLLCSAKAIKNDIFQITRSMPWDKFIRTDFLRKTGIQYPKMRVSEDIVVNRVMLTEASKILFCSKRLINYRIGNEDSLQGRINRYPAEFLKGNEIIYQELIKRKTYLTYKESFEKIIIADFIMHLSDIDTYENFLEIVETAKNMNFWTDIQINENSDVVRKSCYQQTMEAVILGKVEEALAKFFVESRENNVSKNTLDYKIGHAILKTLRLTY